MCAVDKRMGRGGQQGGIEASPVAVGSKCTYPALRITSTTTCNAQRAEQEQEAGIDRVVGWGCSSLQAPRQPIDGVPGGTNLTVTGFSLDIIIGSLALS